MVWCSVAWYGMVLCGIVWYGMAWCGMVCCGVVCCAVVWYGMVWYGMVWHGMVLCGIVWSCTHAGLLIRHTHMPPHSRRHDALMPSAHNTPRTCRALMHFRLRPYHPFLASGQTQTIPPHVCLEVRLRPYRPMYDWRSGSDHTTPWYGVVWCGMVWYGMV